MSADRRPLIHAVCAWRLGIAFAAAGLALPPAAADPPAGERWINIDGAPGWVAGTPVDQKLKSDWRGTRLKPGGYVALRVPARADLRLVTPAGALNADDLEIAVSNGSGMYRVVPTPQPNSGGHLVLTRTLRERLVRIDRPQHRTEPLTVAAFVNLRDLPTTLQQRVSPINGTPVRLRWYQQSSDVEYWPIGAGHRGELTVEGPTRILVDTIVAVSEDREETHSGYRVYARFDDHPPEPIEFAIRLSSRRALIDGRERVLGRRQATQLTVPAGRHRLFLHADAEVYARVSVQTPDDFLLPVNAPPHPPLEPGIAPGSHWDLAENDIQTWAQGARAQRERAALRLARDNHRRGGGLLAAQLLEQSALAFPDNPRVVNLAAAFAQRYTMNRQLLPQSTGVPITHRFHWFASPERYARIAELVGRNPRYRQLALASLENAQFFDLEPNTELVFAIPPRNGDSHLRLAAVLGPGDLSQTFQTFQVQFDDGSPPIRVDLPSDPALRAPTRFDAQPDYRLTDAAVAELTLLPPFASRNRPARLVQAASVTIPLPRQARSVTLKAASGRLNVTAQYRVSRRFALTEMEHEAALRRVGPQGSLVQLKRLFAAAAHADAPEQTGYVIQVAAFTDPHNASALVNRLIALDYPAQRWVNDEPRRWVRVVLGPYASRKIARTALAALNAEPSLGVGTLTDAQVMKLDTSGADRDGDLASHRAPLVRWLAARYASFQDQTVAGGSGRNGHTISGMSDPDRLAAKARRFERDGAWRPALERWRQVAGSVSHRLRAAAVDGQYQALVHLGEDRLAEGYLRDVFHNDPDPAIRDRAFTLLRERYTNEENAFSEEMLLAAAVLRDANVAVLHRLIGHLLAAGRAKDALTLALAMPPSERPLGAIVQASYEAGWWQTFDAAVAELDDDEERQGWLGYRAQARGDFNAAREFWSHAGNRGREARTMFDEGIRIRSELAGAQPGAAAGLAVSWARWQTPASNKLRLSNGAHLLYASAGGAVLHWPGVDGYRQTFRSEPEQPLRLRIQGPQQLEIQARVVRDAAATDLIDDWLEVGDGAVVTRFPLDRARPQPEIDIVGSVHQKPSRMFRFTHTVGPGNHDITLAAATVPLLMQVYTRAPQLPLAVLPTLTAETLQAVRFEGTARAFADGSQLVQDRVVATHPVFADSLLTRVALYEPEHLAQGRPILAALEVQDDDIIGRVTELVRRAEQNLAQFATAIAEAERLYAGNSALPGLALLKSRLDRQADWELLRSAQASAGSRLVSVRGWTPESPKLALLKALSDPVAEDELVVTGVRELGVNVAGDLLERLELRLTLGAVDFVRIEPMIAYYSLDEGARQRVELHAGARSRTVTLPIRAGEHSLKVGVENRHFDQYLRVGLRDPDRDRPLIAGETQRLYHVATAQEPVRFAINGPAWLRIHRRHTGAETHEFRYLGSGWQTLTLEADPGAAQSLYRVYRRVRRDQPAFVPPLKTAQVKPMPSFTTTIAAADLTAQVISESELIRHRRGGWSVYGAAVDRRAVDEDRVGAGERFGEFGAEHRHHLLEASAYFRTTLLGRVREFGGSTLGMRERIDYRPDQWPINLRFDADLFAQQPSDGLDSIEWSAHVQARADRTLTLNDNTRHRPRVRIFARHLSLNEDEISNPGRVDQDVFSQYKNDHRHGLSFEDLLTHQPWADTRWYGGPALTTNEDLDPLNPDYVQARAGWTQLIGDWVVDSRYQYRRYFSDSNRSTTVDRHQFRLAVDWDPLQTLRRWHLDFAWIHDFASSADSLRLAVRRDIGAPNATRDYYPGEVQFLRTRRERTAAAVLK